MSQLISGVRQWAAQHCDPWENENSQDDPIPVLILCLETVPKFGDAELAGILGQVRAQEKKVLHRKGTQKSVGRGGVFLSLGKDKTVHIQGETSLGLLASGCYVSE
jgi:hypothetical protein